MEELIVCHPVWGCSSNSHTRGKLHSTLFCTWVTNVAHWHLCLPQVSSTLTCRVIDSNGALYSGSDNTAQSYYFTIKLSMISEGLHKLFLLFKFSSFIAGCSLFSHQVDHITLPYTCRMIPTLDFCLRWFSCYFLHILISKFKSTAICPMRPHCLV